MSGQTSCIASILKTHGQGTALFYKAAIATKAAKATKATKAAYTAYADRSAHLGEYFQKCDSTPFRWVL